LCAFCLKAANTFLFLYAFTGCLSVSKVAVKNLNTVKTLRCGNVIYYYISLYLSFTTPGVKVLLENLIRAASFLRGTNLDNLK